jgi:hypothetical protein
MLVVSVNTIQKQHVKVKCATSSDPMPQGCHSCVVQICDDMPSCCDKEYTQECVDKVDSTCNLECQ